MFSVRGGNNVCSFDFKDEFDYFKVEFVVFGNQNVAARKFFSVGLRRKVGREFILFIERFKREIDGKRSAFVLFAVHRNGPSRAFNKFFDYRKSQSHAFGHIPVKAFFLRKRLVHNLDKLFVHTDTGVRAYEPERRASFFKFCFATRNKHAAVGLVVFDGVGDKIHKNSFKLNLPAPKIVVRNAPRFCRHSDSVFLCLE